MEAPDDVEGARVVAARREAIASALRAAREGGSAEVLLASADDPRTVVRVRALLESIPGMGKVRARSLAREAGVGDFDAVRDVDATVRASLLARCRESQ